MQTSLFVLLFILAISHAKVYNHIDGWYKGKAVKYYDFGSNSPTVGNTVAIAPIYVPITGFDANGDPVMIAGQGNISPVNIGQSGYSDLWQVVFLIVPNGYVANTIRNSTAALSSFTTSSVVGPLVNCPFVEAGSTLEGSEFALDSGWWEDQLVYYFNFGENPSFTAPIYAMPTVADQYNIIDVVNEDEGYSDFWKVETITAPSDYTANDWKSFSDVTVTPTPTNTVVNCPVVWVSDTASSWQLAPVLSFIVAMFFLF